MKATETHKVSRWADRSPRSGWYGSCASKSSILKEFISPQRKVAKQYNLELKPLPITTPLQLSGAHSSYHLYPIRVSEAESGNTQRQVYDELWKNGVAPTLHHISVHQQPGYEVKGFNTEDFSEAEKFHLAAISLPMFEALSAKTVRIYQDIE